MRSGKWATAFIIVLVFIIGTAGFVLLGGYNVAADEPHWRVTTALLDLARERSIESRADALTVPGDLDDAERIARGAGLYDEMCTACHLKPGGSNTELREGLYPRPPDLAKHAIDDPAEAFWVAKHGIKMTAMPAWGKSHTDEQLWDVVAFLRRLPDTTPAQYRALTTAGGEHEQSGNGHHTH